MICSLEEAGTAAANSTHWPGEQQNVRRQYLVAGRPAPITVCTGWPTGGRAEAKWEQVAHLQAVPPKQLSCSLLSVNNQLLR